MLVGMMIGQRTPGVTVAEARAFEERINQAYVDHLAGAGWGYYGVYQVEGLVPGAFGEILLFEGEDLEEAMRRDQENDANLTPYIEAFYAECAGLFWQRGKIGTLWRTMDEPPPRDTALKVTLGDGTFEVEPVDAGAPEDVDVVAEDDPRVPTEVPVGAELVFHPFVMAPLPTAVAES
jgi:hypothetical protein